MSDELKGFVDKKLENADPKAVAEAARAAIGELPPAAIAQHAQIAMTNLNDRGEIDLAKELADLLKVAGDNPVGLKNAVISFIEHHPETLDAFRPKLAKDILGNV